MTAKPDYERGGVKLWNCDCLELLPTLEAGEIQEVITDPPYGISLRDNSQGGRYGRSRKAWEYGVIGDENQDVGKTVVEWAAAAKLPTAVFANPKLPWPGKWASYLVWDKGPAVGGGGDVRRCWKQCWELIQVARNKPLNGQRDSSVLRYWVTPQLSCDHPAAKPLELMRYLIEQLSKPGETIFDPFMGSGSTLVACVQTNRRGWGYEINPKYFDLACKRIDAAIDAGALFDPTPPAIRQGGLFEESTP